MARDALITLRSQLITSAAPVELLPEQTARTAEAPDMSELVGAVNHKLYLGISFRYLLKYVSKMLEDGSFTRDDMDSVIELALELFDEYVAPYDIPGLPPFAEAIVDNQLRKMIPTLVTGLFDRFLPA